jgi:membrane associated rhomboid family serine protease
MAGAPDLFVVCKNCGSEVSPYITECPYCGQRLRKRAPKLERDESGESRPKVRRKPPTPSLGRLRPGEMPGIRADELRKPYVTIVLIVLGAVGALVLAFLDRVDIAVIGPLNGEWWRVVTTPFVYGNGWYQFIALLCIGVFGWLLERRHGPVVVLLLWLAAASGGAAVETVVDSTFPVALGGNGGALGLLAAWAVPVVLARRTSDPDDDEADLLGVLVIGVVVAAIPIGVYGASAVAGSVGAVVGVLAGLVLARAKPR